MTKRKARFPDLFTGFEDEMRKQGFSYATRLYNLHNCNALFKFHEARGTEYLNAAITAEYTKTVRDRYDNGEIGRHYYASLICNITRFANYAESGRLELPSPRRGSTYSLTPKYEELCEAYLASANMHPNTQNDARWVAHKYFAWLISQSYYDISDVCAEQLQKFLLHCSKEMAQSSLHDVNLHLKKLYAYLYGKGLSDSPYTALLSFKVNRESRIYPPVPKEDIEIILGGINRNSKRGKRDYAIMLLGAVTGLRAIDVTNMKLTDIDWINGTIKIFQSKTGKTVILPLTRDVGEAIRDYILNSRPQTNAKQIFLRCKAPHTPFKSAVTIGNIYQDCCKAVGMDKGKAFHALRRTLGRDMVTNGVPVTTVAQVLGHSEIDSAKKYIALDGKHLKLCALGFDGIAFKGGGAG